MFIFIIIVVVILFLKNSDIIIINTLYHIRVYGVKKEKRFEIKQSFTQIRASIVFQSTK